MLEGVSYDWNRLWKLQEVANLPTGDASLLGLSLADLLSNLGHSSHLPLFLQLGAPAFVAPHKHLPEDNGGDTARHDNNGAGQDDSNGFKSAAAVVTAWIRSRRKGEYEHGHLQYHCQ